MTIDRRNVRALVRSIAYDRKGSRLGRVAQVFLDDRTDEPAWVAVDVTRVRGMRLLPLAGAGLKGRHLVIRAERSTVRSAPRIDLGDGQLSSQDESVLLEHYGLVSAGTDDPVNPGEQRPATPWSDDTERETAWERPAQQQDSRDDNSRNDNSRDDNSRDDNSRNDNARDDNSRNDNDQSHGWEQPIGDRGAAGPGVGTGVAAGVGAGVGSGPFQQRDTAPSPTSAAPIPPSSSEPPTAADATGTGAGPSTPEHRPSEPASEVAPSAPEHQPSEPATAEMPSAPATPPEEPTTPPEEPTTPPEEPTTAAAPTTPAPPEPPRPDAGSTATRS